MLKYTLADGVTMSQKPLDDFFVKSMEESINEEIYVLDTETTGLKGAPDDVVVDIGITKVDLNKGTVEEVFSSVLGYDVDEWDDYLKNAWIFENTDMTLEMVRDAPHAMYVIDKVRGLLRGKLVTSYNVAYDMDKFLYKEPWNMKGLFMEARDIMLEASKVCNLPNFYGFDEPRYPKLDYAYAHIVKGDPAGINGKQDHRALSDAVMASYLMIQLYNDGHYHPCDINKRKHDRD